MNHEREVITRQFCKTDLRALLHRRLMNGETKTREILVVGFQTWTEAPPGSELLYLDTDACDIIGLDHEIEKQHGVAHIETLSPFDTPMTPEQISDTLKEVAEGLRHAKEYRRKKAKEMLDKGYSVETIAEKQGMSVVAIKNWIASGALIEVTE